MAGKRSAGRHARTRETPRWLRIVATGIGLGIVIVVAGALMNRPAPTASPVVVPAPVATASVAATTPSSTTATPSATSSPGTTPNADSTVPDSTGTTPLAADAYTKAVSDLGSLLPHSVSGYNVGEVETSTASAIVSLEPATGGPLGKATLAVLTVFDKKTVAAAQTYVDQFQRAYPKDLGSVTIGTLTGRFGTDGSHLAAAVFSRGRYAFEVVVTATRGAPRDLEQVVLQAADAFGATKTAP